MKARVLALCLSPPLCLGLTLPAAAAAFHFTDVQETAPCCGAIMRAVENGVTSGTLETAFSSGFPCTRGQAITFLYRAAQAEAAAE